MYVVLRKFVSVTSPTGTHSAAEPDTLSVARQAVAENGRFEHVYETNAGCTVTCHCGPHTLGILFIHK